MVVAPAESDVLAPLHGVPVLLRTVAGVLGSGVVERVVVLVPDALHVRARRALDGLPVTVSADPAAAAAVLRRAAGSAVLVHDAARPLTPPTLVAAVARSVPGHGVAVPVLPLADTVKHVDADGLVSGGPDRAALRVVQTPQGLAPASLAGDVLACVLAAPPEHAWRAVLAAGGGPVVTVPGDPLAFPVRSVWDRERAEALAGDVGAVVGSR